MAKAFPIGQNPQERPVMMKIGKARLVGGVLNPDILCEVSDEPHCVLQNIKLNKATILAYKPIDIKRPIQDENGMYTDYEALTGYKLWTSGGLNFYTTSTDFMTDKKEEENEEIKNLEAVKL